MTAWKFNRIITNMSKDKEVNFVKYITDENYEEFREEIEK